MLITKCRRIQPAKQCDVVTDRRYRFAACHRRWGTDTREPVASTVSCISFMSVWSVCGNSNTWGSAGGGQRWGINEPFWHEALAHLTSHLTISPRGGVKTERRRSVTFPLGKYRHLATVSPTSPATSSLALRILCTGRAPRDLSAGPMSRSLCQMNQGCRLQSQSDPSRYPRRRVAVPPGTQPRSGSGTSMIRSQNRSEGTAVD